MNFQSLFLLALVTTVFTYTNVTGQDLETTTETVTYPFPDIPNLPAEMPLPSEIDSFADFPLDAPVDTLPNQLAQNIESELTSKSTNLTDEKTKVHDNSSDTFITATTMTSPMTSELTTPTEQADLENMTTVAANFDPSFLKDNSNPSDLILISDPSLPDSKMMPKAESVSTKEDISRTVPSMTTEGPHDGKFTEIEIFPVNQTKNYSTHSADTTVDRQESSVSRPNYTLDNNTTQSTTLSPPVSDTSFSSGIKTSSADATSGDISTIGPPVDTITASTSYLPQISTQSTTEDQSSDTSTQSVTVVNEANIEDYLITRPRMGTSIDTITVDVGNINQYVTTKQKEPTKPSLTDTMNFIPDSLEPPPPPPYEILNENAGRGQNMEDQFNNILNAQNSLNSDFQPRAQQFPANSGLSKELALIMAYRNADRNMNRIVGPNPDLRRSMFPQGGDIGISSGNRNNNLLSMGESHSNFASNVKDQSLNDIRTLDKSSINDNLLEETRPTPIDLPFDPDFDLVRAPPDPNSLPTPKTTIETATSLPAITTTMSKGSFMDQNGMFDIPPPPFTIDGVPPPPPSEIEDLLKEDLPPIEKINKQSSFPSPVVSKSSKDIYPETSDLKAKEDKVLSDVTKDSKITQKRPDIYSSDVKSLYEKDKKFVANFNPMLFGSQPDYLKFGAPMAGLPWMDANQIGQKTTMDASKDNISSSRNDVEKIDKKVDSKPPPIVLDNNRESSPTKPSEVRSILQDTLRNELISQQLDQNKPRTRVYFGSNDQDSQNGNTLSNQDFDQKLALWGSMVRQQLTQLQAGRRESVRELSLVDTGMAPFRGIDHGQHLPPSIGRQNNVRNQLRPNTNDIIKTNSNRKENPSWVINPSDQKSQRPVVGNVQTVEKNVKLPPPVIPIDNRPPPPINILSNNQFPSTNPNSDSPMSVRKTLTESQAHVESKVNDNPPSPKETLSGLRVFNYWKDSNSGRQSVKRTSSPEGQSFQGINSVIQPSKRTSSNSDSQFSQRAISDADRQPQETENVPALNRPPPINIDFNEQSTSTQQRISREIQTGKNDPTFINSAVARRNMIRTFTMDNPNDINLSSKSNPELPIGTTINLFRLPKIEGDLFNIPNIGPMYQSIPEKQNNVASKTFQSRNVKEGSLPFASQLSRGEGKNEVRTTADTPIVSTNGMEIITLETVPPIMEIPTSTIINIGFSEFTDPPAPVEVQPTNRDNLKDTVMISTDRTTIAKRQTDKTISNTPPTETSRFHNAGYNTIDSSPPDLLSNGYTPTPILIIDNYQTSPSPTEYSITTEQYKQPTLSTESTTVGNTLTKMQNLENKFIEQNLQDNLKVNQNINKADIPHLGERIKSPASPSPRPRKTSDIPPPISVGPVTKAHTLPTTTRYIPVPTPHPTTPIPITTPTTPPPQTTFKQLTKEEIIKRLQKDSVLKAELPPEVCHQCHYVNDVCFMSEASICNRFVECIKIGGQVRAFEKECSLGNFWNPNTLACDKSYTVNCEADPCKDSRLERHPYNGRCSAYWICTNSTSSIKCCPKSYRYSGIDKICIPDPTCDEPCEAPTDIVKDPPKLCPLKAVPGNLFAFSDGYTTQNCAPGTRFDFAQCTCVKSNLLPEGEVCKPDTVVDFEGGKRAAFKDKSGRMNGIGEKLVILRNGTGLFYGTGKLSFWRYANVELGPMIAIKIRFRPYGRSKKSMGLLSNCNGTPIGSTIDIRLNTWTSEITFKLSTNQKLDNEITLQYKPFMWNEAIFIYDGSSFSAASNEQTGQIFVEGSIPQRHPEIQVGGCSPRDGYLGYIDDVYVYNGCIPEEVDWVIFAR